MRHACAVNACGQPVQRRLLCGDHWRAVPADVRHRFDAAWRRLGAHRPIPTGASPWDDYERARRALVAAAVTGRSE